jgi:hypothetical protein
MSPVKLVAAFVVAAFVLAGCGGIKVQPAASGGKLLSRGRVDDPRTNNPDRVACLQADHLPVTKVGATTLQIGSPPDGPTVVFDTTPGAAQADQIHGTAHGAEVIGAALLYPNMGSDSELSQIEGCLSKGVQG